MRAATERAALVALARVATCALACASTCALAMAASPAGPATPWPDIDAIVSHETRQVMASGVTRVDRWQERLVRRGRQVWTERVLQSASAAGGARDAVLAHIGQEHFDSEIAAHWLTLGADGQVDVKYVDRAHRTVVSIPHAEFGTVGFDGSFEAAASIVPASIAMAMQPAARGAATNGAHWRIEHRAGWSHRVLWSTTDRLALKVESQREDGSIRRVVSVQLRPSFPRQAAPWSQLGDFTHKHYDDFMD